ncbi:hypothetical protein FO519_001568 [Halicephalobus sp. NKZ332]|nr:hypothetical protein FO519_001568 [Halicephalobus sp. NKZ332]
MEAPVPLTKPSTEPVPLSTSLRKPIFDLVFCFCIWFLISRGPRAVGLHPPHSGFFCNDESIRLPRVPEIISDQALYIYVFALVCVCIIIVELYCLLFVDSHSELISGEAGKSKLERYLLRILTVFSYFLIAYVITYSLTSVSKLTVGRLRPRFLDVCRPNIDIEACSTQLIYISDYECTNENEGLVLDGRRSFFSGHSSQSMVAGIFCVLYVYARLSGVIYSEAAVPLIQFGLISSSLFVGWSRYVDHSHHWSDIIVGQFVGAIVAYLIIMKVAKMFPTRKFI